MDSSDSLSSLFFRDVSDCCDLYVRWIHFLLGLSSRLGVLLVVQYYPLLIFGHHTRRQLSILVNFCTMQ